MSIDLSNKRRSELTRRMDLYKTDWVTKASVLIAKFTSNKARVVGDERLETFLGELMKKKEKYTEGEAELLFN